MINSTNNPENSLYAPFTLFLFRVLQLNSTKDTKWPVITPTWAQYFLIAYGWPQFMQTVSCNSMSIQFLDDSSSLLLHQKGKAGYNNDQAQQEPYTTDNSFRFLHPTTPIQKSHPLTFPIKFFLGNADQFSASTLVMTFQFSTASRFHGNFLPTDYSKD